MSRSAGLHPFAEKVTVSPFTPLDRKECLTLSTSQLSLSENDQLIAFRNRLAHFTAGSVSLGDHFGYMNAIAEVAKRNGKSHILTSFPTSSSS